MKIDKVIKKIDKISIMEFSKLLRNAMTSDFEHVVSVLFENKDKISEFFISHIRDTSLGELGVFLYTLYLANKDVFEHVVGVLNEYREQIVSKAGEASISEIAEFLCGISFNEGSMDLARPIIELITRRIEEFSLQDLGEFLTYLSIAEKNFVRDVLSMLKPGTEKLISKYIVDASLNDIAVFFSSVSKIDRSEGIELLNKHRDKIMELFAQRLSSSSIDDVSSFLLLIAQVDVSLVEELLEGHRDELERRFGDAIKTIEMFIRRIPQ